ncbi:MAG: CHAD domain-containing protein [Anaerolineales bacterium]|nr:CHAD domain-containing protein [Anaerolineales bacterium]
MSEDLLLFTAETEMAEVARPLLAAQLSIMEQHRPALVAAAEVTAVHETRKAIRRTFTGFKLFRPFFEPGVLEPYRRRLRKMMRYLGAARDTAVFRQKLHLYMEESGDDLACLAAYWEGRQAEIDEALCGYMGKPKREKFWQEYGRFVHTPGLDVLPNPDPFAPMSAAHYVPVLIYQRLAGVRAYANRLENAPLERLHMLRIQGKELRYTLQFFAPLLGPEIEPVQATLERMQEHLGALQDAAIGLKMLAETVGCETAVAAYRAVQAREITQLVAAFPAIWHDVNSPAWRRDLAAAISVL